VGQKWLGPSYVFISFKLVLGPHTHTLCVCVCVCVSLCVCVCDFETIVYLWMAVCEGVREVRGEWGDTNWGEVVGKEELPRPHTYTHTHPHSCMSDWPVG
jgi:hypothetical protein